ncbi:MAG: hypothetical protein JWR19_3700 [Pedosphaera sp.]|nr:hypothetical protein [Pedosphaera sp.]
MPGKHHTCLLGMTPSCLILCFTGLSLCIGLILEQRAFKTETDLPSSIQSNVVPTRAVSFHHFVSGKSRLENPTVPSDSQWMSELASIQAELEIIEREKKIQAFVQEMAQADIPAALKFLMNQDATEEVRDLRMLLLRRWTEMDPQSAADFAIGLPTGDDRSEAIDQVSIAWANLDISQAVRSVEQWPEEERQSGLRNIAYEAARTDPIQALTLAVELPASQSRDDLISHSAAQWALTTPETALAWAKQIPDEILRDKVIGVIATVWASLNPMSAAYLAVTLPPGRTQDDAIISIVERWVQTDPKAAAAWVELFPDGPLRKTAIENMVKLWPAPSLPESQSH